ncbi:MAG: PAS domain-containing protein [Omnitrophica bacterium]|nr:PAS domain-containing protein [Candidatus Omnitrophota bacterium]
MVLQRVEEFVIAKENITEKWETIFNSIRDPISIHGNNFTIVKANKACADLFNMNPQELLGKSCCELFHGTKKAISDCPSRRTTKTKKTITEIFFEPHLGKHLEVSVSPICNVKGEVRGYVHIVKDITEYKRIERELQSERNKLQSIIGAMKDGLSIHNLDYDIIYQNEILSTAFGGLGKKCYRVYEDKNKVCDGCPVKKAFKDGKSHISERKVIMPSGELAYWENMANPIRDPQGKIVACLEVARNISERKSAEVALKVSESKLREQKISLEQKNIALSEILEQIGIEKRQIKEDVALNVEKVLLPLLERLRVKGVSRKYLTLLRKNLQELTSSFGRKITDKKAVLSPREIEICNMIKNGLSSKEISILLNVSLRTIEKHRFNIRKKLGIGKKSLNLTSFLQNL